MQDESDWSRSRWLIFAIPATVVVLPLVVGLILRAVIPGKQKSDDVAMRETAAAPSQPPKAPSEPEPPAPQSTPVEPEKPAPAPPAVGTNAVVPAEPPKPPTAVALSPTPAIPPPPAPPAPAPAPAPAKAAAIDLLSSLDAAASAASGEWRKEGSALRCTSATPKARAKLRLVAPPTSGGYDFAVTFTVEGERRFLAQVLSFRGKQFIFAMFSTQSGFASVKGQNALGNETTRSKGITSGTKHTSVVKVRDNEVSAYLDGELLTSYLTDYSDLDVSPAWNLGANDAKESLLGLAVECPVTVEAISLTALDGQAPSAPATPTTTPTPPAPSPIASYKQLAEMISSTYSRESSIAATQPAARKALDTGALQKLVAASQPVVSEVAAELLKRISQPGGAGAGDELFLAVQDALTPDAVLTDPLMDVRPSEQWPTKIERADFDAEQSRLSAWQALTARMEVFYPNAKSARDLVKLQLGAASDAPARSKRTGFFATHNHTQPLSNVTLAIELVHANSAPSPTAVQHYFIANWPRGEKIYFPAGVIPNLPSRELLSDPDAAPMSGLSGLLEARAQLWSEQAAQPKQETKFDINVQPVGRALVAEAYRLVDETLRRPAAASRPTAASPQASQARAPRPAAGLVLGPIVPIRNDLTDAAPELERAKAAAGRALALLPPQSQLIDDAKALQSQPLSALRQLRKGQVDAIIAALPLRSTRKGVWVKHQPGLLAKLSKAADREAAASGGGHLTMTVDSRMTDGSEISVTLNSAEQADVRRKFAGRLHVDASNPHRLLLNLRATQPRAAKAGEADAKRLPNWTTMLLELRGNSLVGIATAGPTESTTVLNVAFGEATEAAKPAPNPHQRPTTPAK